MTMLSSRHWYGILLGVTASLIVAFSPAHAQTIEVRRATVASGGAIAAARFQVRTIVGQEIVGLTQHSTTVQFQSGFLFRRVQPEPAHEHNNVIRLHLPTLARE